MVTIRDLPISKGKFICKKLTTDSKFRIKTPEPSCAIPGAFIEVRLDDQEILKAGDINQKLKFLVVF